MFKLWNNNNKVNKEEPNITLLLKKAKNNDIKAQYKLSTLYYNGKYVAQNIEKAKYWLTKAIEREEINKNKQSGSDNSYIN